MGIVIFLLQLVESPPERIFWQPGMDLTRTVTDGRAPVGSINSIDFHILREMNSVPVVWELSPCLLHWENRTANTE